jgi:hypothetical protein
MKTNYPLQKTIGCQNAAQDVLLAALFLKSALSDSPAVIVRAAVAAVAPKAEVIAQNAKPAITTTIPSVPAAENTTGKTFGELYLNSPAYPAGTLIPAITPKPASNAVVGVAAVIGVPAVTEIKSPVVTAIKGWEDAITIENGANNTIIVTAELPVSQGVGLSGSSKIAVREVTPSALQPNVWLSNIVYALGVATPASEQVPTMEEFLYNRALLCESVITDTVRTVLATPTACKKLVVTLHTSSSYSTADSFISQLVRVNPQVFPGS